MAVRMAVENFWRCGFRVWIALMGVRMGMPGFVQMLGLGLVGMGLVRVGVALVLEGIGRLGEVLTLKNVDLRAGDAATVDGLDLQLCPKVHSGGRVVHDLSGNAGFEESSEEHVAGDAGEAVEIGDAHVDPFIRLMI